MPQELFLVRHGQPAQHSSVPYLIAPGPDLSERGRLEAHAAAAFLAAHAPQRCLMSPFARTTQTAEIISRRLALPAETSADLAEHGPQETFPTVRRRLTALLQTLQHDSAERLVLVTHGSPIRALLQALSDDQIDLSAHVYQGGNPAPTCGIWHIDLRQPAAQRCQLVFRPAVD
jgi:2,3-bisphosphoglycerate-dependent phosphoglycerate mutase